MADGSTGRPGGQLELKMDRPHIARVYDYYLGGKTNYEADRYAGDQVLAAWPGARTAARTNRIFMHRAARTLARELGLDQFLDIGTGIPTEPNLHQIVQGENPRARVVYVDNDPLVLAHARALMNSTPEGRTAYVHADFTEPDSVLLAPELTRTLDAGRPVALSVLALLHFVLDEDGAYGLVRRFVEALPSGSALVLTHGTSEFAPEAMGRAGRVYTDCVARAQTRSREEFARFFDGLELVDPGIEVPHRWRPDRQTGACIGGARDVADAEVGLWAGLAVKP
ncbi:methyltransferase [Streptomyces abyssalis]|uniref:Methyltransferase n=1 Tax=Streptomyces abyssalis TaxID=933944 RepID=A0A1E7JJR5_9ACTN|nr:SAM-dependent methyltransferase [Streptomyces abyssalis]OEU87328.1 methyltransferase [Streptomyces abyssalis]OEU87859.1 methyltransferase [Streptomyces abyssalis]OEV29884.1 methyltransferase [Streptomyces nanshensis]